MNNYQRLAAVPRFNQVNHDSDLALIGQSVPELLTDAWALRSPAGDNQGADGFLAINKDELNNDGSPMIYLVELYQFASTEHTGDVVTAVITHVFTSANAAGEVVNVGRVDSSVRAIRGDAGGEFVLPNGVHTVILHATRYDDALQEAARYVHLDQPAQQTASRLTRRLRRTASRQELIDLVGMYTTKRLVLDVVRDIVQSFDETADEYTEQAARQLIHRFTAAHGDEVAQRLVHKLAGMHQNVNRLLGDLDDTAVAEIRDTVVTWALDELFIDEDGYLQTPRFM